MDFHCHLFRVLCVHGVWSHRQNTQLFGLQASITALQYRNYTLTKLAKLQDWLQKI